jgi:hypothetical protein
MNRASRNAALGGKGWASAMSKRRCGGYSGGSTVIRASLALPREKTKEHNAKVQAERERLAAEQRTFEEGFGCIARLVPKHIAEQKRARRRAERKAQRRSQKPTPGYSKGGVDDSWPVITPSWTKKAKSNTKRKKKAAASLSKKEQARRKGKIVVPLSREALARLEASRHPSLNCRGG